MLIGLYNLSKEWWTRALNHNTTLPLSRWNLSLARPTFPLSLRPTIVCSGFLILWCPPGLLRYPHCLDTHSYYFSRSSAFLYFFHPSPFLLLQSKCQFFKWYYLNLASEEKQIYWHISEWTPTTTTPVISLLEGAVLILISCGVNIGNISWSSTAL